MSDIRTDDDTGDIQFVNGDIVLGTGADAVKQAVRQELRMFKGEWFLDLDHGVPYYQDVLVKNPNAQLVEGILINAILSAPGVLELMDFSLDYDAAARTLTLNFQARAYDGVIDFTEVMGAQGNG